MPRSSWSSQPTGGDPALGSEGYTLVIAPGSVKLTAASDAGLFHGVQTLRQLLVGDKTQDGRSPITRGSHIAA